MHFGCYGPSVSVTLWSPSPPPPPPPPTVPALFSRKVSLTKLDKAVQFL